MTDYASLRKDPFLLMIGDDGAILVPPQKNVTATPMFVAHNDDKRRAAVFDTLAAFPRTPVVVVADTLTQEFRRDTLPRLNVLDRRKLLARRLRQHFPCDTARHAPLARATTLNGHTALYMCLHDESPVYGWMHGLTELPNPFEGITPLPLVGVEVMTKLHPQANKGWCLLLSWQQTGGFRQIVTREGEFVFTRLTPPLPPSAGPDAIAEALCYDLRATMDYLGRLGLGQDNPLRLLAVLPSALQNAVSKAMPLPGSTLYLSPHEAASRLDLNYGPIPGTAMSDIVYAAWLSKHRRFPALLLPSQERQRQNTQTIKRWGNRLAWASCLLATGLIAWQALDFSRSAQKTRALQQAVIALDNDWNRERARLAPVTEPLGRLQQALARQRLFAQITPMPWELFKTIDNAIGQDVRLVYLNWETVKPGDTDARVRLTIRLPEPEPAEPDPKQATIRHIEGLAQTLQMALPDYTVTVSRYPFLIRADETVSNATENKDETKGPTADFIFQEKSS